MTLTGQVALPGIFMDHIYSVSEITHKIKTLLESGLPDFMLEGEISEFRRHSSGHLYFTLKDSEAVIPSVMWKTSTLTLSFQPRVGDLVQCRGTLSVYPPQGKYQFVARSMKPAGAGDLFQAFETLKLKLKNQGLFNPESKKPIPPYPDHIAIITSETGAVLQDMLRVFNAHAPHIFLSILPARVQGSGSAEQMIRRITQAESLSPAPRIIILARGGGSLEDLWEFNSEMLAHRIHSCSIPIISAVGHETDFSISDFVADLRASTPTAAAETCVKFWKDAPETLNYLDERLHSALESFLDRTRNRLDVLMNRHGFRRQADLLLRRRELLFALLQRLDRSSILHLDRIRQKLDSTMDKINILNPGRTIERGFSINRLPDGSIIRSISQMNDGDLFSCQYRDGILPARVQLKSKEQNNG